MGLSPERKSLIGDYTIVEYWWARAYIVYVNNKLVADDFDTVLKKIANQEPIKYAKGVIHVDK